MLLIRFQPRRVANCVAGLTLFWCGILSAFFWIKGFNFPFLVMLLAVVAIGFLLAGMETDAHAGDILKRLGFNARRKLPLEHRDAFLSETKGVRSSIGPVPFQYTPPARLDVSTLKPGAFSDQIQKLFPAEILQAPEFLNRFVHAIDSGPHRKLVQAILEVYCHPKHIGLPAGVSRHNNAMLLTHCLRVAALMQHRVKNFKYVNYQIFPNDENYRLPEDDGLLIVVGLSHDLGKIDSFIKNQAGVVVGIKPDHHKSGCRILSALPEFWGADLSAEDRYILQSCSVYATDYASSPIKVRLSDKEKPTAISDRFQSLLELVVDADIAASQIENGVKYKFSADPVAIDENSTEIVNKNSTNESLADSKLDLFTNFSEFISSFAIINGKGSDRSVGFKYLDPDQADAKHLLFIDDSEFVTAFANFLKRPEWGSKDGKVSGLATALLPKLDEAGYLVRSAGVGAQPAVNSVYRVDFSSGDPPEVKFSLKACFVVDLTVWPHQTKLRNLASCEAKPAIINSIFGNKFAPVRQSLTDAAVLEELGAVNARRSECSDVESLVSKRAGKSTAAKFKFELTVRAITTALARGELKPATVCKQGEPIAIANSDAFFQNLGINVTPVETANDLLKQLGILSIRKSKQTPGTHIVVLDGLIYSAERAV